MSYNASD
jgi:hypothetical protein